MVNFLKKKYFSIILKRIIGLMLCMPPSLTSAQVYYSTDPNYLKGKSEQNNLLSTYRSTYPDTSLVGFSNYFPRNFMGNLGLPSPDYILSYGTDNLGFRYFSPPTDNDRFDVNKVKYFRTKGPYAGLTGIAGSKRYEIFKMLFTHTYRDKINITAGFQRYTSKGFYNRQQSYTNNFFLSSNYSNKKNRAGYYLYILNNGNKNQESGGITDGRLNDSTLKFNKELFSVNINSADRENTEQNFMFNPWIKLNAAPDSLSKWNHYLQIKSNLINSKYTYTATNLMSDKYYANNYYDTLKTLDSSHVRRYVNDFSYSLLKQNKDIGWSLGYINEQSTIWQRKDSSFTNHLAHTEGVFRKDLGKEDSLIGKKYFIESKLSFNSVLAGLNQGNYKLESNTLLEENKPQHSQYFIDFIAESRNADHMQRYWQSNHFIWNNPYFKSVQQTQLKIGFKKRGIQVFAYLQSLKNYVYFDKEALPKQSSKTINNLAINLNYIEIFFKHLGFSVNYLYQNTSAADLIRIPQSSTSVKLFFSAVTANNNLHMHIGAQLSIYEAFTSYAYMPSTQAFYLQDNFKTESYPYLDLYLNVRIRPVSFFVRVENILYGYAGSNYAFVPGYYQPDRAFRFGINWMFFD